MFTEKSPRKIKAVILLLSLFVFMFTQCSKHSPVSQLPKDILGISVGMNKPDAQKRLEEIAVFDSENRKTGQLWRLKNDSHFSNIAVAYDADNKIRFVTALVDGTTAKQRMRFIDVGDLASAEKQITEPHHKYYWDVPATEGKSAYRIFAYGSDSEFLTIYSLSKEGESEEKE